MPSYFWCPGQLEDKLSLDEYESLDSNAMNNNDRNLLASPSKGTRLVNHDTPSKGLLGLKMYRYRGAKRDGKNFRLHRMRLEALAETAQVDSEKKTVKDVGTDNVQPLVCSLTSEKRISGGNNTVEQATDMLDRPI